MTIEAMEKKVVNQARKDVMQIELGTTKEVMEKMDDYFTCTFCNTQKATRMQELSATG